MNKTFNEDNYIDFSISTIFMNHLFCILAIVFAYIFVEQSGDKDVYLGSKFMFWFCLCVFLYNLIKIIKHSINKRKSLDVIRTDYEYSNKF